MGSYETVMAIAGFLVVSHLVLVTGGGGEIFFDLPGNTTAPVLFPEPQESEIKDVDLEKDAFDLNNVEFVDSSSLSNPDAAFESDTVAVLTNGSSSGYVSYNLPGVSYVEVESTSNCGGILGDSGVQIGSEQNTSGFDYICGQTVRNVEESNVNFVTFKFDGSGSRTPRVFSLRWSKSTQATNIADELAGFGGAIVGIFEKIGQLVTYPVRLWDYFKHFPIYMKLFYGTILAWMAVDIIQIG